MLSTTKAKIFAYYPRQASGVSLTSIQISNDGTDWLYTPYAASDISVLNPEAKLRLQHAITIIRVKIVAGNEYATGAVSDLTLAGNGWATAATLNLQSGKFGSYEGEGIPLTAANLGTLSMTAIEKEFWVVSNETESVISFKTTVGEEQYKVYTPTTVKLERGKIYNYTVTVDNYKGATLSSVQLSEWTAEANSDMDTEYAPWLGLADGVYAIDSRGLPVDYETASAAPSGTYQGVAVSMKGKAFEVAKENASEGSKWVETSPMSDRDAAFFSSFYIYTNDGTNTDGYLMNPDGSYYSSPQLSNDIYTWTDGALADVDGKTNTDRILAANVTIASVIRSYNDGSHGYTDWYLPAAGQLAYMFMNNDKLKSLMGQVSGADPNINRQYYSSSVISDGYVWNLYFPQGRLGGILTTNLDCVRLVRNL